MIKNPTYRGVAHPWHCDHMGHMNVKNYVGKFDEASWNFFSEIGLSAKRMNDENTGVAALQQNITYMREVFPGETVVVNSRVLGLKGKIIRFVHEMTIGETGEPCATCEFTVVHMDRKSRKSIPFPKDIQEKLGGI